VAPVSDSRRSSCDRSKSYSPFDQSSLPIYTSAKKSTSIRWLRAPAVIALGGGSAGTVSRGQTSSFRALHFAKFVQDDPFRRKPLDVGPRCRTDNIHRLNKKVNRSNIEKLPIVRSRPTINLYEAARQHRAYTLLGVLAKESLILASGS
jgi:hypothetical protein